MFLAFLIFDPTNHFSKATSNGMPLQDGRFSKWSFSKAIALVFFRVVFYQNNFNVLPEGFDACFWHF